jgi:hypothetical protein
MKLLLSLLFFHLTLSLSQAQWLKEKGDGYYKIGTWSLLADEHYTNNGKIDPNATRGHFNSSLYAHYGLSNKVNLIAYLPFFVKNYQFAQISQTIVGKEYEPRRTFNSIGDFNIGAEIKLSNSTNWNFSTTLVLGIPSGKEVGGFDGSYQTGDGEFNQQLQVNIGKSYSLGNQSFYLKTYLGYNNRTKGFSDELHSFVETGTQFWKNKLLLISRIHWIKPLYNGFLDASTANGTLFANNIESFSMGGEAAFTFGSNWGIALGATAPVFGKIVFKGTSFSGGFFINY